MRRHTDHCEPYQRSDDSELPHNSADSGNSDNDRDSSVDSDAARKNVCSEVNLRLYLANVLQCRLNVLLRPRCNLKQPSKLRDSVCSCGIR